MNAVVTAIDQECLYKCSPDAERHYWHLAELVRLMLLFTYLFDVMKPSAHSDVVDVTTDNSVNNTPQYTPKLLYYCYPDVIIRRSMISEISTLPRCQVTPRADQRNTTLMDAGPMEDGSSKWAAQQK